MNPIALNAYAYSGNNPIYYVDPNGETFWAWVTGKQSTEDFVIEIGQAGEALYQSNALAKWMMDHPYSTGLIIGVGTAVTAAGVSLVAGGSIVISQGTVITLGFNVAKEYDKINKATQGAYELANKGGTHSGMLNNLRKLNTTIDSARKGIQSFQDVVNKHLNWIKDPTTYEKYDEYSKLSPTDQAQTIKSWYEHAVRNAEQMHVLGGYLNELLKKE